VILIRVEFKSTSGRFAVLSSPPRPNPRRC